MKKCRIVCLCLAMVMLFSALPFAANAAANPPIAVGDTKTVVIEEGGGYLLFDFTPEETGTYVFWSTDNESEDGILDTYGEVYVGSERVAYNDDGYVDNNFRVQMEMTAGTTYTLKARAYSTERTGSMKVHFDKPVKATDMTAFERWFSGEINLGGWIYSDVSFFPANAIGEEVTFKSSDSDVIAVYDDEFLAVGAGTATITATSENGLKDSVKVTVQPAQTIKENQKITVSPYNPVPPTFKFKAPADGIYVLVVDGADVYGCVVDASFEDIGYVKNMTDDISIGYFEAEKGKTYYVPMDYHYPASSSGKYTVTVQKAAEEGALRAECSTYIGYPEVWLYPDFLADPINAFVEWYDVELTSSDTNVAVIHDDDEIECIAPGTATITAVSADGMSCTFKVEVRQPKKLTKTGSYKFTTTVKEPVIVYEFTPKTSGQYYLIETDLMYSDAWFFDVSPDSNGFCELTGGETYYFCVEGVEGREQGFNLHKKGELVCHTKGHKYEGYAGLAASTLADGIVFSRCSVCGELQYKISEQMKVKKSAEKQFKDVKKKDWFFGAVNYAFNSNLFNGVEDDVFAPNDNMTRGMFVTVLGRMSGVAENKKATTKFEDVPKGRYYTAYVKWASDNGIVNGMSATSFAPEENITREQICVMIERFMKHNDLGMRDDFEIVKFKDEAKISKWAKSAVLNCQAGGIVNGQKGEGGMVFNPQGNATRAEVATILHNFDKNYRDVYNYFWW